MFQVLPEDSAGASESLNTSKLFTLKLLAFTVGAGLLLGRGVGPFGLGEGDGPCLVVVVIGGAAFVVVVVAWVGGEVTATAGTTAASLPEYPSSLNFKYDVMKSGNQVSWPTLLAP